MQIFTGLSAGSKRTYIVVSISETFNERKKVMPPKRSVINKNFETKLLANFVK